MASAAEPRNTTRNAALLWASALMPRIAASAVAGSVRSRPRMVKVEKA